MGSEANGICVYCASSPGKSPLFIEAAKSLGSAVAQSSHVLVYGGGQRGLMGQVSLAALEAGGRVTGVIPEAMLAVGSEKGETDAAKSHPAATPGGWPGVDVVVVHSMHERKLKMAEVSKAFVALPGGFGTMEELFEVTTWSQLGIHAKPVILLNVDGFYAPLRDYVNKAVAAGFIHEENARLMTFVDTPADGDWGKAAVDAISSWETGGAVYKFNWKAKSTGVEP